MRVVNKNHEIDSQVKLKFLSLKIFCQQLSCWLCQLPPCFEKLVFIPAIECLRHLVQKLVCFWVHKLRLSVLSCLRLILFTVLEVVYDLQVVSGQKHEDHVEKDGQS